MDSQEKELMEIVSPVIGNRRKFILLRIADMGLDEALGVCNIKKRTYFTWMDDSTPFATIYRRKDELSGFYKQEAIKLLRRENQLAAVLLEGQIIQKIKEEVDSGDYSIIKTPLAKEVYTKLISNLDFEPKTLIEDNRSWENSPLYQQLLVNQQPQLGGVPNERIIETDYIQEGKCSEGNNSPTTEQSSIPIEKENQEG
jgi:hypothetical protein